MTKIQDMVNFMNRYPALNGQEYIRYAKSLAAEEATEKPAGPDPLGDIEKLSQQYNYRLRIEANCGRWAMQFIPLDITGDMGPSYASWGNLAKMVNAAIAHFSGLAIEEKK